MDGIYAHVVFGEVSESLADGFALDELSQSLFLNGAFLIVLAQRLSFRTLISSGLITLGVIVRALKSPLALAILENCFGVHLVVCNPLLLGGLFGRESWRYGGFSGSGWRLKGPVR